MRRRSSSGIVAAAAAGAGEGGGGPEPGDPWQLIQGKGTVGAIGSGDYPYTLTLDAPSQVGNVGVFAVAGWSSFIDWATTLAVSDDSGLNTWELALSIPAPAGDPNDYRWIKVYICQILGAYTEVTASSANPPVNSRVVAAEFSELDLVDLVDVAAFDPAGGLGTTWDSGPTAAVELANSLVLGFVGSGQADFPAPTAIMDPGGFEVAAESVGAWPVGHLAMLYKDSGPAGSMPSLAGEWNQSNYYGVGVLVLRPVEPTRRVLQRAKLTSGFGAEGPFTASGSFLASITPGSAVIVITTGAGQFNTGSAAVSDSIAGGYTPDRYTGGGANIAGVFSRLNHPGGAATISVVNGTAFAGEIEAVAFEVARVLPSGAHDQGGDNLLGVGSSGEVPLDGLTAQAAELQVAMARTSHVSAGAFTRAAVTSPPYIAGIRVLSGAEVEGVAYTAVHRVLAEPTAEGVTFETGDGGNWADANIITATYKLGV